MARVVQSRSNPPYLLFVFVFLFLIAATMAVIGFMEADKIQQGIAKLKEENQELTDDCVKLERENAELARYITGSSEKYAAAKQAAADAVETTGLVAGLATELKNEHQHVEKLKQQIENLNDRVGEKEAEIRQKDEARKALLQKQEEALAQSGKDKAEIEKDKQALKADYEKRIKQFEEDLAQVRKEMQSRIDEKNNQLESLVLKIQEQEQLIAELRNTVDDLKATLSPGETDVVNRPDGEIARTSPGSDICYVTVGKSQGVRQGMTFAVYGSEADYKGEGKGKVRVTQVGDNISECKIIAESPENPIVAGDGVANLAFSPSRTYNFVVQGRFDLYGTGQATALGRQSVKDAIQRFGGRIEDEIDVQTDYVVMGVEPAKPAKPAPDALASAQRAYQEQMQRYQEYQNTKQKAIAMKIPVLNGNRFMDLTGFLPEAKPE